jgi:hypothetical protein
MYLAIVAVVAMLVVRWWESDSNSRGGGKSGSRRGICKVGGGCVVYSRWGVGGCSSCVGKKKGKGSGNGSDVGHCSDIDCGSGSNSNCDSNELHSVRAHCPLSVSSAAAVVASSTIAIVLPPHLRHCGLVFIVALSVLLIIITLSILFIVIAPGVLMVIIAISKLVVVVAPGILIVVFALGLLVFVIALDVLAVNVFGKGLVFIVFGNGRIVISAPAARPLHSIFHCCLRLLVDCCVCFPNVLLTKPRKFNNACLHMDQLSSFNWCATMPQAE